jgi:hypothetical protein
VDTKKTKIFRVFHCEMQIKWVRDNIMTDLTWKVQIQSQVNGTYLTRVCWMIVRHKKTRIFRVFYYYCVQRKWVIDKSYGRFSMKSENTISNKWNDSHQSVLDNFWTQKTRIFCVFDCEMQRKWVRDKSYGRFSMQSKNTISNKWNDSYQSVLDDLWAQKTTIFRVFH